MRFANRIIFALAVTALAASTAAHARYGPLATQSTIDPKVIAIDEEKHLGAKVEGDYVLIDEDNVKSELNELMGRPLVLVLSYYTCDGSCTVLNHLLKKTLLRMDRLKAGVDYNVLTLSFDKKDDVKSLRTFARELKLPASLNEGWRLAILDKNEDIKRLTDTVGFNYFWSPADRVFLHPAVFIFISPDRRVVRYLYAPVEKKDVELAILEAGKGVTRGSKLKDLEDLFLVACFSYNFTEGKYTLNYPLFIAVGALALGVSSVVASLTFFKPNARRNGHE
jgi:protein SCO1/2